MNTTNQTRWGPNPYERMGPPSIKNDSCHNRLNSLATFNFEQQPTKQETEDADEAEDGVLRQLGVSIASFATTASVSHPVRNLSACVLQGKPFTPYGGFTPALFGYHQFFVMAAAEKAARKVLQEDNPTLLSATIGGLATVPTLTVCDLHATQQLNQVKSPDYLKERFELSTKQWRGIGPVTARQMLGCACINGSSKTDFSTCFAAAVVGAVATQIPEMARSHMQSDWERTRYKSSYSAYKQAFKDIPTLKCAKSFAARLAFFTIATYSMRMCHKKYGELVLTRSDA